MVGDEIRRNGSGGASASGWGNFESRWGGEGHATGIRRVTVGKGRGRDRGMGEEGPSGRDEGQTALGRCKDHRMRKFGSGVTERKGIRIAGMGWKNFAKEGSGIGWTMGGILEGYGRGGRWFVEGGRGRAVGRNQQGS